ncbi:hypothetical protein RRG08_051305 [Elysia crispata]|uniref:Uncharacterized protein n=1 Tax=Elysia crispata TaxID=231223 RepID=A0AAE0XSC6_9GAST|nr:hypothetical protein RRG08_051305 [Elysia crispata]
MTTVSLPVVSPIEARQVRTRTGPQLKSEQLKEPGEYRAICQLRPEQMEEPGEYKAICSLGPVQQYCRNQVNIGLFDRWDQSNSTVGTR